jgi:hypothetical protein
MKDQLTGCVHSDPLLPTLPQAGIYFIDHVVGNQPDLGIEPMGRIFARTLIGIG